MKSAKTKTLSNFLIQVALKLKGCEWFFWGALKLKGREWFICGVR